MIITLTVTSHEPPCLSGCPDTGARPVNCHRADGPLAGHLSFIENAGRPNRDEWTTPKRYSAAGMPSGSMRPRFSFPSKVGATTIRRLLFMLTAIALSGWSQPPQPPAQPPIAVQVQMPPTNSWIHLIELVVPGIAGGALALCSVLLTSKRHERHELRRLRAEKQLDLLSRIGQLLYQTERALEQKDKACRARELGDRGDPKEMERTQQAHQALLLKRDDLGALVGSAGFVLSDPLWQGLQAVQERFIDACDRQPGDRQARDEQLRILSAKFKAFNRDARLELEPYLPSR